MPYGDRQVGSCTARLFLQPDKKRAGDFFDDFIGQIHIFTGYAFAGNATNVGTAFKLFPELIEHKEEFSFRD